jgi:hypothetical protein
MTEQQIEAAARKLCEIRGIDPDLLMSHGAPPSDHGYVPMVLLHTPAWRMYVSEVRKFWEMAQAVDFAVHGAQFP